MERAEARAPTHDVGADAARRQDGGHKSARHTILVGLIRFCVESALSRSRFADAARHTVF
jgi:hypothetical protein